MTPEERAVHALTGMMMRTEDSLINMVTEQIEEACDEARLEQLHVDQQYWRGKLFDLKYDKKLAAVFFEELWRTEERERCAKVARETCNGRCRSRDCTSGYCEIAAAICELK